MLSISTISIALALGFVIFYWQFRMRSKEIALSHAKRICENYQLQLLDQSIAFTKITIEKRFGKYCFIKVFEFDYADGLQNRKTGSLLFHKNRLLSIYIDNQNIIQATKSHNKASSENENNVIEFPKK